MGGVLGYLGTKQRYAVLLPNIQPDTHFADLAKAPSIPLHCFIQDITKNKPLISWNWLNRSISFFTAQ